MSTASAIEGALAAAREDGAIGDESTEEVSTEETEVVESETPEGEETTEETTEEGDESTEEVEEEAEEETTEEEEEATEETEEETEGESDPDFGPAKDKHGRENKLPHSRLVKIRDKAVAREVGKVTSVIGKALGYAEGKVTTENIVEVLGSVGQMRQRLTGFDEIEPIMRQDGDTFIQMLADANPEQYGKFLAVLEEGYDPQAVSKAAEKDMPQPDVEITLQDGTKGKTYSMKQLEARDAWKEAQLEAKWDKKIAKRFKPLDDERTATQKKNDANQALASQIVTLLGEAREDWDGFTENETAIQAEYNKIPKSVPMGRALRQAYNKVVVQKWKTGKAKMRQDVQAELKAAPKSTSAKGKVVKKVDHVRNEDGDVVTGSEAAVRRAVATARAAGIK